MGECIWQVRNYATVELKDEAVLYNYYGWFYNHMDLNVKDKAVFANAFGFINYGDLNVEQGDGLLYNEGTVSRT